MAISSTDRRCIAIKWGAIRRLHCPCLSLEIPGVDPVRIAVDITPLLGARTGIGRVVGEVTARLGNHADVDPTGFRISWRRGSEDPGLTSPPWRLRTVGLPARACRRLWLHTDRPSLSGYDVVHGLNYVVPPAGGGAELVAVHDLTAWRFPELVDRYSAQLPVLVDRAIGRGAHVHTGSRFVAEEIVDRLGVDPERVHTLVNGHTPGPQGDADAGRRRIGADYVLAIGTIEPRKDYVGLVTAMAGVWDHHRDLRLVIVGRPAWGGEALDRAIDRCPHPERVVRPGFVTEAEKADLLAGARALVYPSLYEGFGFPLLEAMEAGVPVVSTTAGSIPEVAGEAALLVDPGNHDELARAIVAAVGDRDLAADLVRLGRKRLTLFDWDDMVDDLVRLYRRLAFG